MGGRPMSSERHLGSRNPASGAASLSPSGAHIHGVIGCVSGNVHGVQDRGAAPISDLNLLLLIFASTNQRPHPGLVSGPTPAPDGRSPE
jgi:hypothetical protein